MKIFVFGSSLTSTYWNGAATYYRGIYKNLHGLGYQIIFAEPAIYDRQAHQDVTDLDYVDVRVYQSAADIPSLLKEAAGADVVIKHSGVGAEDERLEKDVLGCRSQKTKVVFWDVDAPATLASVSSNRKNPFRKLIEKYDAIFTYGGGSAVIDDYERFGAKLVVPIYNGLDPETHFLVPRDPRFASDLTFVGHRLPDREARVEEFFLKAATLAPEMSFVLGGEGWGGKSLPSNVRWIGHVPAGQHNVVNCSARMVLNVNRESMAKVGFSPPTRVFEAAGAGACVMTDSWVGVEQFFTPDSEILVASSAEEVVAHLRRLDATQCVKIGLAMLSRALREHTYGLRAAEVHSALQDLFDERTNQQHKKKQVSLNPSFSPA
jgi:spore maturation protein CgeB